MSKYITVKEFKNAPTGIDFMSIIPGGTEAQNDAEIYNILVRASAWVDEICKQKTLEATVNTEIKQVTLNRNGLVNVHTSMIPIAELLYIQYRISPVGPWNPIPLDYIQAYNRYFTIYNLSPASAFTVPESYGYTTPQRMRDIQQIPIIVKYTYVNGYANTLIAENVDMGTSIITLMKVTGVYSGQSLTIYDGEKTESVVIDETNGSQVTLTSPLLFDHFKDTAISAIPASVKQATILLASYLIKERGAFTIAMGETSASGVVNRRDASDVDTAKRLLYKYVRGATN